MLAMFAVGFGANQFVPLLAVYRRTLALSDAQATAIFGVYALGLIPGLLLAGPASDRYGRRPLMLAFAGLSLLATAVLITGRWGSPGLYVGRLLTGVVSGVVFSVGSAWVKELSDDAAPGAGARRAALALTAGFASGPLVAGLLAQWAPAPQALPYLLHLLLAALALVLLRRAPETVPPRPAGCRPTRPSLVRSLRSRRFTRVVLPLAPWVFGSVTLVFTTLPAHAAGSVGGLTVAFPGVLAALALGAGLAVQPLGRRLHDAHVSRGGTDAAATGLALVTAGCLTAAAATTRPGLTAAAATTRPGLAAATGGALLLGAGYGLTDPRTHRRPLTCDKQTSGTSLTPHGRREDTWFRDWAQTHAPPKSRLKTRVAAEQAATAALQAAGATRWVGFTITETTEVDHRQENRGRPGAQTRYRRTEKTVFTITAAIHADKVSYRRGSGGSNGPSWPSRPAPASRTAPDGLGRRPP